LQQSGKGRKTWNQKQETIAKDFQGCLNPLVTATTLWCRISLQQRIISRFRVSKVMEQRLPSIKGNSQPQPVSMVADDGWLVDSDLLGECHGFQVGISHHEAYML